MKHSLLLAALLAIALAGCAKKEETVVTPPAAEAPVAPAAEPPASPAPEMPAAEAPATPPAAESPAMPPASDTPAEAPATPGSDTAKDPVTGEEKK